MTLFQLLMLGASAFFAYKIYEHVQTLKDNQDMEKDDIQENIPRTVEAFSIFSPEALTQRADEAYELEDYSKALALLNEAHAKDPENAEILFKMGYVFAKNQNVDEAVNAYKKALEIDQENEYVHNSLASLYRSQNEYASARMHLNASLNINDTNPATYYNYGNLLVDMKNKEEAIKMYEKALELDPDLTPALDELNKLKAE